MYSAKMIGTDCGLKRRLPNKKGIAAKGLQHGKLSSFHIVEQLLHAGRERHAPVADIGGPALTFGGTGSSAQAAADIARRSLK
jgi:hypothetical protein